MTYPLDGLFPNAMAQRIEVWPIARLVPYAKNARTHSDAQVAQIAASIAEFGFNAPLLVDSNAGIIAGHGRLLAVRKLDLAEVPVIVIDHLSETQKRAYVLDHGYQNRNCKKGGRKQKCDSDESQLSAIPALQRPWSMFDEAMTMTVRDYTRGVGPKLRRPPASRWPSTA